jgi:hypothetical protein
VFGKVEVVARSFGIAEHLIADHFEEVGMESDNPSERRT